MPAAQGKTGWTHRAIILGLTANADEKSRRDCLSAGMDGVVTKSIRRELFLAEVARRLSGAPSEAMCTVTKRRNPRFRICP